MNQNKLMNCVNFFKDLSISETEITTEEQKQNGQLVVRAEYNYKGQRYVTKPLYYKNINNQKTVKNVERINKYFGEPIYWLDYDTHNNWPQGEGAKLDTTVLHDMQDNIHFLIY